MIVIDCKQDNVGVHIVVCQSKELYCCPLV